MERNEKLIAGLQALLKQKELKGPKGHPIKAKYLDEGPDVVRCYFVEDGSNLILFSYYVSERKILMQSPKTRAPEIYGMNFAAWLIQLKKYINQQIVPMVQATFGEKPKVEFSEY